MSIFDTESNIQCRACMCRKLKYQKFVSIKEVAIGLKYHEMLKYLAPEINIQENDEKSQHFCFGCSIKLKHAFQIKQMCIESDKKYCEIEAIKKVMREGNGVTGAYSVGCQVAQVPISTDPQMTNRVKVELEDQHIKTEDPTPTPAANQINLQQPASTLIASKKIKLTDADKNVCVQMREPYQCMECGRILKSKSKLNNHKLRHVNKLPYKCPDCAKTFPWQSALKAHQAANCSKKTHACEICGGVFTRYYTLKEHMNIHSGKRPFRCNQCPATFSVFSYLRQHNQRHSGVKRYQCQYCCRTFSQSGDHKRHLRLHLGEKIYKCAECLDTFKYLTELQKHRLIHLEKVTEKFQTNEDELESTIVKEETELKI